MNDDFRRKRRRKIVETIHVVDAMTDAVVGRLGNLSENGMLLIASVPLVDDALYQLRFNLGSTSATGPSIEVGAHLLWQDTANPQGQIWTGLRFITVLDRQLQELRDWLDAPGAAYE